jgi:hypothetical protein
MSVDMKAPLATLLLAASCATTPTPSAPPPAPACRLAHGEAARPEKKIVVDAMHAINRHVIDCFDRFRQMGFAPVSIDVAADGAIESARVDGEIAGTDQARCIEVAVRQARFPSRTEAWSVCYPFAFR